MFLGHFGLALAAKRAAPAVPLAALLVASTLPDLLDPALSLAGLDGTALTHTAPAVAVLAIMVGAVAWAVTRQLTSTIICAALVASHFLTDLVTSRLELWAGGAVIGWGLYGLPWINFILEAVVICAGWALYRSTLPVERRRHPLVLVILVVLLGLQASIAAFGVE